MVWLPWNEKQTYRLNSKASNVTDRFDLVHDLDLEFTRSNIAFPISQPKVVLLPWNEKQTYRLTSKASNVISGLTLAMTLTLNFQGHIWNFLYLGQKWSDCNEMKSKHIDWTPGLKCDQWIWPWPLNFEGKCDPDLWPYTWPWPWSFMVKFWNSCISEWEGQLTLHKEGVSRSFMAMTMTISWPRSGVWIYQIVTGVTR